MNICEAEHETFLSVSQSLCELIVLIVSIYSLKVHSEDQTAIKHKCSPQSILSHVTSHIGIYLG